MPAPEIVHQLVKRFEENIDSYRSSRYNETQLRREFLDPFFEALGWDVFNKAGYAEAYKDVIHEDSLQVEGAAKAPDYAFRIGGTRKFFVEAKKPFVRIETDIHPAFQLRRYSWSAKLPIGVLTDFEEFAIYETRSKPDKKDKASTGRIAFYKFTEYVEKWDEIADIFSRQAVLKGSFDKFAEGVKGKKGTAEVDDAFLAEIERWRELLARNIALRNADLNVRELNYAVQMTIDRVIFLRICEDRGIEPYEKLKEVSEQTNIYAGLCRIFRQADDRYNSGLFHFKEEKGISSAADNLTLELKLDDKVLREILGGLYYPESPYVFSEIPADILGQVYERFLGKVIRLTAGHQAKVEEKPEVRKAGGVYYTPTYIVEYIVKNTVGKLLEGKTPDQVAKLKILDPACGSGTFPIGAYQYLLDWHRDWYNQNNPQKLARSKNPPIFQGREGWELTIGKKKEILLNNIYGVDIDPQAVEVTKLSLLLKLVENPGQLDFMGERILPHLGANIKCGNSLIGPDYFEGGQLTMGLAPEWGEEERYRVNAFDWKAEFSQVFVQGGFDVVIGNPPYVRMEEFSPIKEYLKDNYDAHEERADFYTYFIELASKLVNASGNVGMIVSNKFSVAKYGKPLRATLQKNTFIHEITDFAGAKVFKGATVRTFILFFSRLGAQQNTKTRYIPVPTKDEFEQIERRTLSVEEYSNRSAKHLASGQLTEAPWELISAEQSILLDRLKRDFPNLREAYDWRPLFGIKTGLNEAFILDEEIRSHIVDEDKSSNDVIHPILFGKDVRRYFVSNGNRFIVYLHPDKDPNNYPPVKRHLETFRTQLNKRAASQKWFELQQPAVSLIPLLAKPKIVYPIIAPEPRFTLDTEGFLINDKLFVLPTDSLYILGILNSSLANFFFSSVCARLEGMGENYYEFRAQFVERFPVRPINFSDADDKARHERMVSLVGRMLELTPLLSPQMGGGKGPRTPGEKERVMREIEATDKAIDRLVYELYGLSPEEIGIVEGRQ